jgi:hypothetical protein
MDPTKISVSLSEAKRFAEREIVDIYEVGGVEALLVEAEECFNLSTFTNFAVIDEVEFSDVEVHLKLDSDGKNEDVLVVIDFILAFQLSAESVNCASCVVDLSITKTCRILRSFIKLANKFGAESGRN